jgi:hypothetical protein
VRTVFQRLSARQQQLRDMQRSGDAAAAASAAGWLKPLAAFAGRLRWRSHFIQKFEMEVADRALPRCRFVLPRIRSIPDPLRWSVSLFLKRRCHR